jgi:hypothetical protein
MTTEFAPGAMGPGTTMAGEPGETTATTRLGTRSGQAPGSAAPGAGNRSSWEAECGCPDLCQRDHETD